MEPPHVQRVDTPRFSEKREAKFAASSALFLVSLSLIGTLNQSTLMPQYQGTSPRPVGPRGYGQLRLQVLVGGGVCEEQEYRNSKTEDEQST